MLIDERRDLSIPEFTRSYVKPGRPVVLRGGASHWPALRQWTLERLRSLGAEQPVEVEVGNAMQGANPRLRMTLGAYIDALQSGEAERGQWYLAVFDAFGLFPQLLEDVSFNFLQGRKMHYRRAWIGARGTISGLHYDIFDNVLAQVSGRKLLKLVSPEQSDCVYVSRKYDFLTYPSEVAVEAWDRVRHPRFAEADVAEVILEPGDVLFIPKKWWHYTCALDTSISVNSGGASTLEVLQATPHFVLDTLHRLRLYRWGWCACHQPIIQAGARPEGT
ncbi:lysine-specific demethylase 8 [Archangium gephyra]|uniref:JmjC domain protein n=1 Tax=Archangium gephyra TaxID=48 RepID=A0AAC8Q5T9_9BACT|nr:cupin-like domain-containing protein [Archangium gephyra]AKJ01609.1 JmjC domain protein [Archangium gephyra]REG34426.1 lysine-specific demethylase 8 [Archangium gephyra]